MKRLNSTEQFLSLVLLAAMAALITCWLTLWERWGVATGGLPGAPTVPPWLMMITLLTGALLTRRAVAPARDNLHLQPARRAIALGGLAAVIGVLWITFGAEFPFAYFRRFTEWGRLLSPEAIAFGVAVVLWWRGIRLGRNDDLHETAQGEFFGGVLALTVLFVANQLNPVLSTAEAFWPTMMFFALGLGAMALAGLEQERRLQRQTTGTRLGVSRHWLITAGSIIGLILTGGVVVAGATMPDSITFLNRWLDTIGILLLTLVGFLIYFFILLIEPILNALAPFVKPILQLLIDLDWPSRFPISLTPPDILATAERLARTPPFRVIEVLCSLGLVVVIFLLAVHRFRLLGGSPEADETRESILSGELVWSQLKSLLGRRRQNNLSPPPLYLALNGPADDPRLMVRRAYQQLLAWAQAQGFPRNPGQTPAVYAARLSQAVPRLTEPIAHLTHTYTHARYGGDVSMDEARRARAVVEQLPGTG